MEALNGLQIPFLHRNLYDLTPTNLGQFDIILLLGVLYHVPDMFRALHMVRQLCNPAARVFIDTDFLANASSEDSCATYWVGKTRLGDFSCWWIPSMKCVFDLLRDANYEVIRHETWGGRMLIEARAAQIGESIHKARLAYGYW
jgi:tRNA (mo5U34)-methyltransferase